MVSEAFMKRVFKIFAAALATLCAFAVTGACDNKPSGDVTPDSKKYKATEEELLAEYEATPYKEPVRGIFITPRIKASASQEVFDEEYAKVKAAGINMVATYQEANAKKFLEKTLTACEKNGLKVILSMNRITNEKQIDGIVKIVKVNNDHPAVIGYNLFDEPSADNFELLGKEYERVKEAAGPEKVVLINFFPNYASAEQCAVPAEGEDGLSYYQTYLKRYYDVAFSDIVSFDNYPYRAKQSNDVKNYARMISNFCDIAKTASDHGLGAWGYVQCGEWAGTRTPNKEELRLLTNIHLLFGLKGYSYFLYVTPVDGETAEGFFQGMVTFDGEPTERYHNVHETIKESNGMKGVYLDFDFKGLMYNSIDESWVENIPDYYNLKDFAGVKKISSEGAVLAGCFEDSNGRKGLYVVNCDTFLSTPVTLTLSDISKYKIWTPEGLSGMGADSEIQLKLDPGAANFVIIE